MFNIILIFLLLFFIIAYKTSLNVQNSLNNMITKENFESMNIKNMLTDILRENKELKSELKNLKITNTNNININVFLNETCKDAMNLT